MSILQLIFGVHTDDMFRGADAARENYCTSVLSMSIALMKAKKEDGSKSKNGVSTGTAATPASKKPTVDRGVGTEELTHPVNTTEQTEPQPEKAAQDGLVPSLDGEDSSDILSFAIGSFGSFLVWVLRSLLFSLPYSVVTGSLSFFLFLGAAFF